jgi:hypothetical protein
LNFQLQAESVLIDLPKYQNQLNAKRFGIALDPDLAMIPT